MHQRVVFIVRLWAEVDTTLPHRPFQLRGSLQQVDGNQLLHFRSLEEVPALMQENVSWIALAEPYRSAWEETDDES